MKRTSLLLLLCGLLTQNGHPQQTKSGPPRQTIKTDWPETMPWWKSNNLRVIQLNLPAYEATLNVDSLVTDLQYFSANTLIINAGGIMAFYPTKLPFHYVNPYMKENMLGEVIRKCHQKGIRVIVRFDFSKAHKSVFEAHPEWFYVSPKGERIINEDMYAVSINAGYEQESLFKIVEEVIKLYEIDGLFMNMPGYQTRNSYLGKYHGIDQNESEKKRFFEFSGGMKLPVEENQEDVVFQKYEAFKKFTTDELMERLSKLVKSKSPQIAICTYMDQYVDIIRHESLTNSLPYWPYMSSDNVNNAVHSYPNHIVSNASIQQISFQSRYNAIEPEEVSIRLYENIANGSGLDISLMGDFRNYEDERNFDVFKNIYAHHKKFEPYFGKYSSVANIAVIAPGAWPGGDAAQEYRGIQLMLKEAHLQYDIIEDGQVAHLEEAIRKYRVILLPQITYLDQKGIEVLKKAAFTGTHLIATNKAFFDNPEALHQLFGAKIVRQNDDGSGYYMLTENKSIFKRLKGQELLFVKFNMGFYDLTSSNSVFLPLLTPGRPGPPESIGGHAPTAYYAMGIKDHNQSKAVLLPINLGKLYYLHGYQQHKNILLDVIDSVFPEGRQQLETNAHPRVEVILQNYAKNIPANAGKSSTDGMILHLVNLTGFSGNTYFKPSDQRDLQFKIRSDFKPSRVFSMTNDKTIDFTWAGGYLSFTLDKLERFEGIVINN